MMPVTPALARTRLSQLLASGIAAATALGDQLQAERDALERQDTAALAQATTLKQACLADLENRELERHQLLQQTGFTDDRDGMRALTDWCLADAAALEQWQDYLALAKDCQQANMANGAILRLRHQQFASALALLSGSTAPTYSAAGASDGHGTRALGEA